MGQLWSSIQSNEKNHLCHWTIQWNGSRSLRDLWIDVVHFSSDDLVTLNTLLAIAMTGKSPMLVYFNKVIFSWVVPWCFDVWIVGLQLVCSLQVCVLQLPSEVLNSAEGNSIYMWGNPQKMFSYSKAVSDTTDTVDHNSLLLVGIWPFCVHPQIPVFLGRSICS